MDKELEKLSYDIDKLETHLLASINEAKVGTESVLKQLAAYLNISAKNLTDVHESSIKLNSTIESVSRELEKIDKIENMILQFSKQLDNNKLEIKDIIERKQEETDETIKQTISYIRKLGMVAKENTKILNDISLKLKELEKSEANTREELLRNQTQLFEFFGQIQKGETEIKLAEINTTATTKQEKIKFWLKIAGYVAGSGGLLYVLIDLFRGLFG